MPLFLRRSAFLIALAGILVGSSTPVHAQVDGGDGGGDGGGGAGGGVGGGFVQPIAGIDVDAAGVLQIRQFDPRLANQRLAAARAAAAKQDIMRPSELRKVSLRRLEKLIADANAAGQPIPDEARAMAGLTSVKYVFYYPESNDIVVAGPAEGFFADQTERLIGTKTGAPTVLLEDMVTAMRAFAPGAQPTQVISVSIDPTADGLQRMQNFLASVRGNVRPSDARRLAAGLKNNLGLQTVTFRGIPDTTHFARVLVEADYRMKLIGIGLEKLPVRVMSYVDRANPRAVAANAMERWYFQPNYDGVAVSEDSLAMEIKERGVQLVGENERVVGGGNRVKGSRVNRASQAFTSDFTKKFNQIAAKVRVYAELRQLIDIAIAAAYIQEQDFYTQANWDAGVLMDEDVVAVQTYNAPEQVETAVNAIWRGNTLMTPLGGGVQIAPTTALRAEHLQVDSSGEVVSAKAAANKTDLADGQWWWD